MAAGLGLCGIWICCETDLATAIKAAEAREEDGGREEAKGEGDLEKRMDFLDADDEEEDGAVGGASFCAEG